MFKQFRQSVSLMLIISFVALSLYVPQAQAGEMVLPLMPTPGVMVHLSPEFVPAHLQGITIHPDNALQFDFLINKGDGELDSAQKNIEYTKLIKYFLASLTIPDEDQWVNLSPYEHNRIIQDNFGKTQMGRDLLTQDYLLKQITSSLMYPESNLGKEFWDKVYQQAQQQFGSTQIPVNTFNKVWITPDEALVYESGNTAYILKSHLKVMLEEDYLSLKKHTAITGPSPNTTHTLASKIVKQIILPELEREVNEDKNFAMLRQIYSGMVLATWYKKVLRESLLGQVYADRAKVRGVDQNPRNNQVIYRQYLKAFKKGVFNYIKEDVDTYTQQMIPRKYFAGGFDRTEGDVHVITPAMITADQEQLVRQATEGLSDGNIDSAMVNIKTVSALVSKARAMWSGIVQAGPYIVKAGKNQWNLRIQGLTPSQKEGEQVQISLENNTLILRNINLPKQNIDGVNLSSRDEGQLKRSSSELYSLKVEGQVKQVRALQSTYPQLPPTLIVEMNSGGRFMFTSADGKFWQVSFNRDLKGENFERTLTSDRAMQSSLPVNFLREKAANNVEEYVKAMERVLSQRFPNVLQGLISNQFYGVLDGRMSIEQVANQYAHNEEARLIIKRILVSGWLAARYGLGAAGQNILYAFLSFPERKNDVIKILNRPDAEQIINEAEYMMQMAALSYEEILRESPSIGNPTSHFPVYSNNGLTNRVQGRVILEGVRGGDVVAIADHNGVARFVDLTRGVWLEHSKDIQTHLNLEPAFGNPAMLTKGGIDLNSANLNLLIKRDGKGVPLPLSRQNMAQLMQIQGFVPQIIEIRPITSLPALSELHQKFEQTS